MNNTTKKIVISALLVALNVVLTRIIAINTPLMKIGLGFFAIAMGSALFGPWWGAVIASLGDIVGTLLIPTGAYFPGFTVTAALTGIIFGLFLYKKKITWINSIIASALNVLLVTYFFNTLMISYVTGTAYAQLLKLRAIQLAVMFPIEAVLLAVALPIVIKRVKKIVY